MIVVSYGGDIAKSAYDALEASDIRLYLKRGMAVSIKPNLVVPRPAYDGATTHPEVVDAIIRFLKHFGITKIKVIESSWVGDSTRQAFDICGYKELCSRHGVPFIDLKSDSATTLSHGDTKIAICDEALDTDFLINVPVLKAHCQTRFTCCMKNLKGCIPDSEKSRFHAQGLHKHIAVLSMLLKTGYCVVDGICGDLSAEAGGNPVESNRIIAGRDPLVLDSYCAELIGYEPDEIKYLSYGKQLGLGDYYSESVKVIELNAHEKPVRTPEGRRHADRYSGLIDEDAACSACYSSLVYALHKSGNIRFSGKFHIGQGFKGKGGDGFGIGNCARGFKRCVLGCPPKATDIASALRSASVNRLT